MKKKFLLILCVVLLLGSCKKSTTAIDDNWNSYYGYTPKSFPIETINGYGFIDNTGKTVINPKPQFNYAGNFSFGYAKIGSYNYQDSSYYYGFIDETGNWKVDAIYYNCGNFSKEGFAPVQDKTFKYGYINKNGAGIPCMFDTAYDFHDGLAPVVYNGYCGLIDINGGFAIQANYLLPPYPYSYYFNEGYVFVEDTSYKWGLLDKIGNKQIGFIYDDAWLFTENVAAVFQDSKWKYIKIDGNDAFQPQPLFDFALPFFEGYAAVAEGNSFGFIDKTGKFKISTIFDDAYWFSEGLAVVKKGNYYGYIDKSFNGSLKIPANYLEALDFSGGLALVNENNIWKYIDKSGKLVRIFSSSSSKSATLRKKQNIKERLRARLLKGD